MFKNKKQKGFTLIELLVVIAIIGLLASIVLVSINKARTASKNARIAEDMHQLTNALELYRTKNNVYPAANTSLSFPGFIGSYDPNFLSELVTDKDMASQIKTVGNYSYMYLNLKTMAANLGGCSMVVSGVTVGCDQLFASACNTTQEPTAILLFTFENNQNITPSNLISSITTLDPKFPICTSGGMPWANCYCFFE